MSEGDDGVLEELGVMRESVGGVFEGKLLLNL